MNAICGNIDEAGRQRRRARRVRHGAQLPVRIRPVRPGPKMQAKRIGLDFSPLHRFAAGAATAHGDSLLQTIETGRALPHQDDDGSSPPTPIANMARRSPARLRRPSTRCDFSGGGGRVHDADGGGLRRRGAACGHELRAQFHPRLVDAVARHHEVQFLLRGEVGRGHRGGRVQAASIPRTSSREATSTCSTRPSRTASTTLRSRTRNSPKWWTAGRSVPTSCTRRGFCARTGSPGSTPPPAG